ncbi:non-contractile tail tubular protein [Pseudomonas phage MR1]|uniref:Non-contractile tail tubular protein n=1 Tax=Pseudomonas phage MR1 TaxID=2711169 RepID=A0A6M3T8T2_9CAUD|nr:non-contractile tail tubular protein [Pseudomonas phage MR1]
MGLVSQSTKNLKGGISQQPNILRFSNQGEMQINGWSSETQGLQKRPPTTFLKRLAGVGFLGSAPLVHLINRDAQEQYYVAFSGGGMAVWDLKGNWYNVRNYNGYANCANPRTDLRIITIADYTFVVNRQRTVQMAGGLTWAGYPRLDGRALINVRGGQYGRTLSITINGDGSGGSPQASIKMPNGSAEKVPAGEPYAGMNQVDMTDAGWIANELAVQLQRNLGPSGWGFSAGTGWILITAPANDNVRQIATRDGYADTLLNGFIYQVQTFNKLPANAPGGYIVEITGESARSGDNYWVQYDASAKVWKETAKPKIIAGLEPSTMPHALIRAADGQFDWTPLTWDQRNAGDDDTNPMPSFVGDKINDVFFFRNRLGFLAGENVVMSRTSRYFNFFPSSVATLSDDDPIDVAISHNRISILKYAVPFSEQLLLWSDQAQFVLSSNGILSSKTIELDLTTEFDVSDGARPYGIGRGVYFAAPRASFTSLKRYYAIQDVSDVKSAEDVSAHVPSYLPNTAHAIHGSGTENFVSILSDGEPGNLYIYKFLYLNEQLQQQSFSHWNFGANSTILAAASIGSYMHLMIQRPEGICLERMEFTQHTIDYAIEPYRAYMDMKKQVTLGAYNIDTNQTELDLTSVYGGVPGADAVFYTLDQRGVVNQFEGPWNGASKLYFTGNRQGEQMIIGKQYVFQYEFSKFLIKQTADDGTSSTEDIGRLQLRRAWLNYEQSGEFEINVNNGSTEFVYVMSGGRLGQQIVLGELSLGTGQFKFPCTGNALNQRVTITSDSPNPLNVIGCGWEGNYIRRSSGI